MKNKLMFVSRCILLAAIAKWAGTAAFAQVQEIQHDPAVLSNGSGACAGKYTAYAKMTNSANGTVWLTPPTNIVVTNGVFSDLTTNVTPYSSYATVVPLGGALSCASNSITFPATNGGKYQLMMVVTNSPSPVTNRQPLTLSIQWNVAN